MQNFRLNHNELLHSLGLPISSTEDLLGNNKQQNFVKSADTRGELLLCMTIDLGEGKKDILNVYSYDDPKELARHFCIKHQLNLEAVDILTENILDNLKNKEEEYNDKFQQNSKKSRTNIFDGDEIYKNLRTNEPIMISDYDNKPREYNNNNKNNVYERLYHPKVPFPYFFNKYLRLETRKHKERQPR